MAMLVTIVAMAYVSDLTQVTGIGTMAMLVTLLVQLPWPMLVTLLLQVFLPLLVTLLVQLPLPLLVTLLCQ